MRAGAIPSPAYREGAVSELPAYIFMVPQEVSRCILQAYSMYFFENRTGKRTIQHIFVVVTFLTAELLPKLMLVGTVIVTLFAM